MIQERMGMMKALLAILLISGGSVVHGAELTPRPLREAIYRERPAPQEIIVRKPYRRAPYRVIEVRQAGTVTHTGVIRKLYPASDTATLTLRPVR